MDATGEADPGWPTEFPVRIPTPEIGPWAEGNAGVPGVWRFAAREAGPHLAVVALTHGNEIAGAGVLVRLLESGFRPARGTLTLVFANLDAFARFDRADPTATRFLDEDLNRVWDDALLAGARRSSEMRRARALAPLLRPADLLLDLHSMLWPSDPLILAGRAPKARTRALAIGAPSLVVGDEGHVNGPRLIDWGRFADPADPAVGLLLEAGPHWEPEAPAVMEECVARVLRRLGMASEGAALAPERDWPAPRLALVTRTVTAASAGFAFVRGWRGGEVVARRNTLIALDGEAEIRTPHDDCVLVMPSPRTLRGHTAVRLARFAEPGYIIQGGRP
jgi:predicted deacylase